MGGDGGVIASNRRYMRGAGTADHTADAKRSSQAETAEAEREKALETLRTCAVSGASLDLTPASGGSVAGTDGNIVACPHGKLYGREAAVEALIRRKQRQAEGGEDGTAAAEIGWHVRGLKDLYPVRFSVVKREDGSFVPVCPITGIELNGSAASFLVVRRKSKKKGEGNENEMDDQQPNVLTERAMKEMGGNALQEEYGPFEADEGGLVRLAPPASMLEEIRTRVEQRREEERIAKASKKEGKKRKKAATAENGDATELHIGKAAKKRVVSSGSRSAMLSSSSHKSGRGNVAEAARSRVATAVASNSVLSSLFESKRSVSEKEKKDNLFAR